MANRQALFGIPGYMKWIPCPLSGLETEMSGNRTMTGLLNGRTFIGGSFATSKKHTVNWLGTIDELQDLIDFNDGIYGGGPFYYTDPMAFDNALSPVYAAPHLLQEIEQFEVTGIEATRIASPADAAYGLPPFSGTMRAAAVPNYSVPSAMTVAIPPGYKAVVRSYAASQAAIRVATGTGKTFALASVQPAQVWPGLFRAEYSGIDFVSLHFASISSQRVDGLVVQLVPTASSALETKWRSGRGHTSLAFGDGGLSRTAYMSKNANGKGLIALSGTLVEV